MCSLAVDEPPGDVRRRIFDGSSDPQGIGLYFHDCISMEILRGMYMYVGQL